MFDLFLVALVSYLAGAIPFSYIAGRVFGGVDLRRHGSGNLGATNTFRLLGARIALVVLAFDVAKGFVPVAIAPALAATGNIPREWLMLTAAFFAVIGHMFSVFVSFAGGKGIATTAGAFAALAPWPLVAAAVVFGLVFAAKRIVSLASIVSAVLFPIAVFVLDRTGVAPAPWPLRAAAVLVTAVVLFKHRSNMRRLARGEESVLQRIHR
jgi:acyl phosphate:glycerol-3-phosphate acyltransferase